MYYYIIMEVDYIDQTHLNRSTSKSTAALRKSLDATKAVLKFKADSDAAQETFLNLQWYTETEIKAILEGEEWT